MSNQDRFLNPEFKAGTHVPLIDQFYTLQGEGAFAGEAAYFIRVGGCDIGCSWCDEKISWNPSQHKSVSVDEIIEKIKKYNGKTLVITGGEPSLYNLSALTKEAKKVGFNTHVETSGAYKLTGEWDWICMSPKPQNNALEENFKRANELKVIVFNKSDIEWAEKCAKKVSANCKLYLQPEWSRHNENTPFIVDYIKENPKWRISIQSHKFMKIP